MAGSADIGIRVFLDDAASGGLGTISSALSSIGIHAGGATTAFKGLTAQMAMTGVVGGFAVAFAAFAGALQYSTDQASQFQQAMYQVAIATHVPLTEAMTYQTTLMNLGATSTFTSAEIATGIAQMGKAGYSIQDIFNQMSQSGAGFTDVGGKMVPVMSSIAQAGIDLSIATGSTATQGFQVLSQVMAAYRTPANQALQDANLLQFAFEHQRDSISGFSSGLSQVTPDAAKFGVSLGTVTSALDVIGPAMKSSAVAGTALRYMIDGIYSPTLAAQTEMVSLGLASIDAGGNFHSAFYNAKGDPVDFATSLQMLRDKLSGMSQEAQNNALHNLFSTRGGQGASVLLDNIPKLTQYLKQLSDTSNNAGGVTSRYDQMMNTLKGATQGLQTSMQDLGAAIGLSLLPQITGVIQHINDFVSHIRTMIQNNPQAAADFLKLGTVLSGLGVVVGLVAMAMMGIMPPILIIAGIMLAVAVATVGLTIGLMALSNWFKQVMASCSPLSVVFHQIGGVLHDLWQFLVSQFSQSWVQIQQAVQPLGAAFSQLGNALKPLLPVLAAIGVIIGAVLIGAIRGLIQGISILIVGITLMVTGVVLVFTGIVTAISGSIKLLIGIFTLNGALIQQGWNEMWTGMWSTVRGIFTLIGGFLLATLGTIIGIIAGFISGVVNFFQHLWDVLVGHSIVPDMMNAIRNVFVSVLNFILAFILGIINNIINFFMNLGSRVVSTITNSWNLFKSIVQVGMSAAEALVSAGVNLIISHIVQFGTSLYQNGTNAWNNFRNSVSTGINNTVHLVQGLPGQITNALSNLGSILYNSGMAFMQQLAGGITAGITWVTQAAQNVATTVMNLLQHKSPAKMGPLANDDQWMPNMMKMFASGIESNIPILQSASQRAAGGIASAPSTARLGAQNTASSVGGSNQGGTSNINLVVDGKVLTTIVMNNLTGQMQLNGLGRAFR